MSQKIIHASICSPIKHKKSQNNKMDFCPPLFLLLWGIFLDLALDEPYCGGVETHRITLPSCGGVETHRITLPSCGRVETHRITLPSCGGVGSHRITLLSLSRVESRGIILLLFGSYRITLLSYMESDLY